MSCIKIEWLSKVNDILISYNFGSFSIIRAYHFSYNSIGCSVCVCVRQYRFLSVICDIRVARYPVLDGQKENAFIFILVCTQNVIQLTFVYT